MPALACVREHGVTRQFQLGGRLHSRKGEKPANAMKRNSKRKGQEVADFIVIGLLGHGRDVVGRAQGAVHGLSGTSAGLASELCPPRSSAGSALCLLPAFLEEPTVRGVRCRVSSAFCLGKPHLRIFSPWLFREWEGCGERDVDVRERHPLVASCTP